MWTEYMDILKNGFQDADEAPEYKRIEEMVQVNENQILYTLNPFFEDKSSLGRIREV